MFLTPGATQRRLLTDELLEPNLFDGLDFLLGGGASFGSLGRCVFFLARPRSGALSNLKVMLHPAETAPLSRSLCGSK